MIMSFKQRKIKFKVAGYGFLGQYLPSLSINYFAIDKDFEKLAMKWRHYLFYLQPYFSTLGTVLPKSFTGTFSSNSRLIVCEA